MEQPSKHLRKDGSINWAKTILYVQKCLEEGAMCKTIATELGVTQNDLASAMSFWRKKGISLPNMHFVASEGHISTRLKEGILYKQMKVGNKWIQLGKLEGQEGVKRIRAVKEKPVKKIIKSAKAMPSPRPPEKKIDRLPDKKIDPSKMKSVKVSKTTYMQVPIEMSDEEAIERWKEKYQR